MGALTSTSVTQAGVAPAPVAVAASDTIADTQFGSNGCHLRVINGGASPDNVSVADPGKTASSNPGTVTPVAVPAGATRKIYIPRSAIDPNSGNATVTHSFTTTVTCELDRV